MIKALISSAICLVLCTSLAASENFPEKDQSSSILAPRITLNEEDIRSLEAQLSQLQKSAELKAVPDEMTSSEFFEKDLGTGREKMGDGEEILKKSLGLSIDGGGIRGLIPAIWLEALEDEFLYDHKAPLYRIFDYMGGTSIGGILSLGLAHGIPAKELLNLFEDASQRQKIFPKGQSGWKIVEGIQNRWEGAVNWYTNRYNSTPLEDLLKAKFGEVTIDQIRTNVLVTACTVEGVPFLFEKTSKSKQGISYKLWEVARSTSAAPTYFSAYSLEEGVTLVDGGLWANNPSVLVGGRMIKKAPASDIALLSLGTGVSNSSSIPVNVGKFGAIKPLLDVLMNSHSLGNHLAMEEFLGGNHYMRVNAKLHQTIDLDATDDKSIQELKKAAAGQRYQVMNFYKAHRQTIRHLLEAQQN